VDLFASPLVNEQYTADQFELDIDCEEESKVEIQDDSDEVKEYESFIRFLNSQGLKQTNDK